MGYLDYAGLQYLWGKLKEKFAPKSHSHDDRYYTEAEMDGKLNSKVNNNEAGANGLINKLSTADGIPNDATVFISQHNNGETASYYRRPISTLWTYIKGKADGVYQPKGSYAVSGHTHDDRYYTESEMNTKLSGKSNTDHTHKKSQITDFPSSMPASDVYAWAKAATKPSYTKAEVGLGNVDNTADKDKNVKYATSAGLATNAQCLNNDDKYMKFHWSGQKGQPTWLWGGNDSGDMYVYNPSNFNVNYATTAGNGTVDFQTKVTTDGYFGAVRFGNGVQICWFTMKSARNRTFLLPFADINYAIAFSGGYCWLNINNRTTTGFTVGVEWSGYENSYIAIGRWK